MLPLAVPAAALAAVVVSIVLGILGMHALSTHGVVDGHPSAVGAVAHPAAVHAHDAAPAGGGHTAGIPPDASAPSIGLGPHGLGDMVMLCVAMLAAAAVALLVRLALRGVARRGVLLLARDHRVHPATPGPLGTGPPYVWRFSVIRC